MLCSVCEVTLRFLNGANSLTDFLSSQHLMHEMQTVVVSNLVAWASVNHTGDCLPDGATTMHPLLHYCSHLLPFCWSFGNCLCFVFHGVLSSLIKFYVLF